MEEKIQKIKEWLGTGSINIFGLPMSGKDTVGVRLAELLGGKFLSSGEIIRAKEAETHNNISASGKLVPTNMFYDLVLPYFYREDLKEFPLVLSSIGRWSGEENAVIDATRESGHETKAVVILNISESDVKDRWETAKMLGSDRGDRADDKLESVFQTRIDEFREKTLPVIIAYKNMGKLVEVRADKTREEVLVELINKLYEKSLEG